MSDAFADQNQRTMPTRSHRVPDHVADEVSTAPLIRPAAVAKARRLLDSSGWCRANEVAAELVDCLITRRLP